MLLRKQEKYTDRRAGKVASLRPMIPPSEIERMVALFNSGRYAELENLAKQLLERYPAAGGVWMGLGLSLQMQGKDAMHALKKTAELMPGNADAHNNLANTYRERGQYDAALASCRRALKINPELAEAHNNLGLTWMGLGKLDDAASSFRRALKIKPDYAEVHSNLGLALIALGQPDAAVASCRRALEIKPDFADAHNNLGTALVELGKVDAAIESYRRALQLKPGNAGMHSNLGLALIALGQPDAAVASCRRALEIKPDFADAHNNLGTALVELGKVDVAIESYRRALQFKPDFADALSNLGAPLRETGDLAEAAECYRRALEIDPDHIGAMLGLARLYMESGDIEGAEKQLSGILEISPDNLGARCLSAELKKVQLGDENFASLSAIENAVRSGRLTLPPKDQIALNFALGKCFDDIGNYENAFAHFAEGCKMKRATLRYDADQKSKFFDDIMRVFGRETIGRLKGGGDLSDVPIFVLGMPRSGTTLTEQIIASHPQVHGAGELPDLGVIAQRDTDGTGRTFPYNIATIDGTKLASWGRDYVAGLQRRAPEARHITDKMPANFLDIGLIYLMLPNAKIVHVNRNPLDNCLSCFMQLFGNNYQEHTYDLAELGRYYADYARLMQHWRNVLPPGAFLDVQYEDVVKDLETQARRIIDFCGLDWHDACLEFHKSRRTVRTRSVMQVREPIYRSSVERWRSYEKFLGPLLEALDGLFASGTGE